jgi:hypothetical protein
MEFTPASQNGIIPPTELLSLPSKFGVFISSTSSIYGKTILIKAISDAAMYKTEPVTFKTYYNGTTSTLGTAQFVDTANAVLVVNNISTGTHSIWAEWPGEGLYAPVTSKNNPVPLVMAAGYDLPGTLEVTITPTSGTVVEGEGQIDIEAFMNTAVQVTGNIQFYQGNRFLGSVPITNNIAILQNVDLRAGTSTVTVSWNGATIGGTNYQGLSTTASYTVLRGSTAGGQLTISVTPTQAVKQEGDITLTATLNSSTIYPGLVYFSVDDAPLLYGELVNNQATVTARNIYTTGTYALTALWDGNQTGHPRYIEKTTSTNWTVVERATIPSLSLNVSPNPSAFKIETTFVATLNTTTSIDGIVGFYEQGVGQIGTAALVNNQALFKTSSLTTGTKIVYAYFAGSTVEPKYFPVTSNTQTLVVNAGLSIGAPINLTVAPVSTIAPGQYVVDEPVRFTSRITTSTVLTNNVKVFGNNRYKTESTWVNNSATTTTTFSSTGSIDVFTYWVGATIGGKFYEGFASSSTTITVQERATLPYNLILRSSQNPQATGGIVTYTVTATTSTQLTGSVEFYKDSVLMGTSTFQAGVASYVTQANTIEDGIYEISARWLGTSSAPKFYAKDSNTITQTYFDAPSAELITMAKLISGSQSTAGDKPYYWTSTGTFQSGESVGNWFNFTDNSTETYTWAILSGQNRTSTVEKWEIVDATGQTAGESITFYPRKTYDNQLLVTQPITYKLASPGYSYPYGQTPPLNTFPGITGGIRSTSNFPLTGSISVYDVTSGSNTLLVNTSTFLTTATYSATGTIVAPGTLGTLPYDSQGYGGGKTGIGVGYVVWPTVAQWFATWNPANQVNQGPRTIRIDYNGDLYNSSTSQLYRIEFVDTLNTTANYLSVDYTLVGTTTRRTKPRIKSSNAINLTLYSRSGNSTSTVPNGKVTWTKTGWVQVSGEWTLQTTTLGTSSYALVSGVADPYNNTALYQSTLTNITLTADNSYTQPYYHGLDYFNLDGLNRAQALALKQPAGYTNNYNTQGSDRPVNWNTWRIDAVTQAFGNTGGITTSTFWIDSYDRVPTYWAGNTNESRLTDQTITINWTGNPSNLQMNATSTGTAQLVGVDTLTSTDIAGITLSATVYAVYPNGSTTVGGGTVSFGTISSTGTVAITFRPTYVAGPDGPSPAGVSNRKLVITASGAAIATTAGTTSTPVIYW